MKNNENKYFRTSSFYQAAFLFAKDLELVNVDRTQDPRRAYFVFIDSPEREALLEFFSFGKENCPEAAVDSRKLITSIKTLKEKLYQEEF